MKYVLPLLAITISVIYIRHCLRTADRPPEEERSLVIGHLDDGEAIVCDDPDCDIDKTLEMWRNGFM